MEASSYVSDKLNTSHKFTRSDISDSILLIQRLSKNGFEGQLECTTSFEMLGHYVRNQGLKVILISDGPDGQLVEIIGIPQDMASSKTLGNPS